VSDALVILLTGACAAVACSVLGTFLLLRGMSLVGDAVSHAVLPGIVVAFMLTHSVSALPVVLGAAAVGLLTVFLIETLVRTRRVKADASIAIVFPALFALGVLLIARFLDQKDLDLDCVLYGELTFAGMDTVRILGMEVSQPLLVLGGAALANLVFVAVLYKELKLATFDAALAASLGISPVLVHYLLMGAVSVTTVASFEAIGAILVVAFLIVPAAAAHLLTDRLWLMLVLSAAIGIASAAAGYYAAMALNVSISGMMAASMGGLFVMTFLFAPREGVIGRLVARRRARERFALALVLARLAREPADESQLAADLAWPRERLLEVLLSLKRNGLVELAGPALRPTAMGLGFLSATAG
jgi:manganese/zinc/iron transport system permease protein